MAMRIVQSITNGNHAAQVYRDTDWAEYRVRFYPNGTHNPDADYFTDDKVDAIETAKAQLAHYTATETARKAHKEAATAWATARIVAFIESHYCAAIPFRGGILVTSLASQQEPDGTILTIEMVDHIPATMKAARDLLGY